MPHLYTLSAAGCPMPTLELPPAEPGYRLAWDGEELPAHGAQEWYDSIRRWMDIDGGVYRRARSLSPTIRQRIVRVPC